MNIGKYIVERMNSGKWIVYWTDEATRYRNQVIIDNLESVFDNMFLIPHDNKKMELVNLFRLAMTDVEGFFKHAMSHSIVNHLPNVTYFPGNLVTKRQRLDWHLQQFIEAYASLTGYRFSPTELEPFVIDLLDSFA